MPNLLYLKASPDESRSYSVAVANAFVEAWRAAHPKDAVRAVNLFTTDLPALDDLALDAKYKILRGKEHSADEARAWQAVEAVIADFKWGDRYVIAAPMWNFGIPWRLKQYIDVIVQPGYTFRVVNGNYEGLLTGRKALVVAASGGSYDSDQTKGLDFQKPYLKLVLNFIGITDVTEIPVAPTLAGIADLKDQAIIQARALAPNW